MDRAIGVTWSGVPSMNRQRIYCCVLTVILFLAVSVGGSILTARQEQPKAAPKPPAEAPAAKKAARASLRPGGRRGGRATRCFC